MRTNLPISKTKITEELTNTTIKDEREKNEDKKKEDGVRPSSPPLRAKPFLQHTQMNRLSEPVT